MKRHARPKFTVFLSPYLELYSFLICRNINLVIITIISDIFDIFKLHKSEFFGRAQARKCAYPS